MKTVFRSIDDNLSPFETGLKKADGKNREWSLEASAESAMKIKEDEGRGNNAYRTVSPFAGGKTAGYSGGGCFGVCKSTIREGVNQPDYPQCGYIKRQFLYIFCG